jgi:hypothetical protein
MNEERITYFAETDARNRKVKFGIKAKDRTKHVYVIGKTGMGKSTLLENMAVQDIQNGEGMAFIDPHGKTADLLLEYIPKERIKDVIYFAPFDTDHPISFNVLESVDPDKRHIVVSGLMSTFKKIWKDAWSARMEYILTNTLLALLEYPDATLLGVNRMLSDKKFRDKVVACVTDPAVRSFWVEEFANYTERMAAESVPAIQNKIGQFTANALIRNMIGQPKSSFSFREAMDQRKILIINLSKGRIGETNTNLLGGMIITKIYLAALSRADMPDRVLKGMPNFYLFVDEFQSFANESFADILSEARKYKLNLTIAHQYIEQMEEEVRAAVFGNVGTMIIFRVGAYDAEILEKEFAPQFTQEDIVNLGFAQIYLKLMIDGISSAPFSATTLPPIPQPEISSAQAAIEMSRQQFSLNRADVEKGISDWMEPIIVPPKSRAGSVGSGGGGAGMGSATGAKIAAVPPVPKASFSTAPSGAPPVPFASSGATQSISNREPHSFSPSPSAPSSIAPSSSSSSSSSSSTAHASSSTSAAPASFSNSSQSHSPSPVKNIAQGTQSSAAIPTHQPFKVAIAEVQEHLKKTRLEQKEHKPVSLSSLSPKNAHNTAKDATPERVNDLRNALASVLKKPAQPQPQSQSQSQSQSQPQQQPQSQAPQQPQSQVQHQPKQKSQFEAQPQPHVQKQQHVQPQAVTPHEKSQAGAPRTRAHHKEGEKHENSPYNVEGQSDKKPALKQDAKRETKSMHNAAPAQKVHQKSQEIPQNRSQNSQAPRAEQTLGQANPEEVSEDVLKSVLKVE